MGDLFMGSSKTSTEQMPLLTSGQSGLLNNLTSFLGGKLGSSGPQYGGKFTPGITPIMSEWFQDIREMPNNDLWRGATDTLMGAMAPYNKTAAMDYWNTAIKAPALSVFDDTRRDIAEQFAGAGALDSGAFANAMGDASRDLSTNLGATLAQVLYNDKNAYDTRSMQAVPQAANMSQTLANLLSVPANIEYTDKANELQMQYKDWLRSLPESQLASLAPLLQMGLGTRSFENVVTQSQTPGILGPLLKGAASVGSAFLGNPGLSKILGW